MTFTLKKKKTIVHNSIKKIKRKFVLPNLQSTSYKKDYFDSEW